KQFENRFGKWACDVTNIMEKVHKSITNTPTYYYHLHAACDPSIFDTNKMRSISDECKMCKKKSEVEILPESDSTVLENSAKGKYNADKVLNWTEQSDFSAKIQACRSSVDGSINNNMPSDISLLIAADRLTTAVATAHGNCGEMAAMAAHLYLLKYPNHAVDILSLKDPGDHNFVRVSHDDIGTMIIDPWAFRYFKEEEINCYLTNPMQAEVEVDINCDRVNKIHSHHPDNLPIMYRNIVERLSEAEKLYKEEKEQKKELSKIDDAENKYDLYGKYNFIIEAIREKYPDAIFTEGNATFTSNETEEKKEVLKGSYKVLLVKKNNNDQGTILFITEYGLHVWK
ncbi:MAG: hypothetical protein PUP46_10200, partial [Endozoicomonas sp. (ex Botrylloides leachii)]|nr:hypothetical protein [Endozoicomonas sp. (ex Botrylloides leachii)]